VITLSQTQSYGLARPNQLAGYERNTTSSVKPTYCYHSILFEFRFEPDRYQLIRK
jgi:hypothetical protein